jgi:hypothetical protein
MQEPALFYLDRYENPVEGFCRVHNVSRMVGDAKGTSFEFAERVENTPALVFWIADFDPACNDTLRSPDDFQCVITRGTIVRIRNYAGQPVAFQIDHVDPIHFETVKAYVTIMKPEKAAQYEQPTHCVLTPPVP